MKKMIKKLLKSYKDIPIAAKAAMWFVACTMLQKAISFITVPIFTRIMDTEQYGMYSIFLSWVSIITVFCTLNMHNCIYVNKISKEDDIKEKDKVAIPLLSLASTITIILFVIYLIFREFFNHIIGLPTLMVILIFFQILFVEPVNFWSIKQRFEFKYIKLVIRTIAMVFLNAILGIIAVILVKENQALARAVSAILVQLIFGGAFYIYFIKKSKMFFSTKGWKEALKIQLPLIPHGLSLIILSSSDRIMINNMISAAAAGIYSVAYSTGYIINALKNSMVDALRPWIYSKIKNEKFLEIREKTKPILLMILILDIIFIAFAPEIIKLMAPPEYYNAIYVIPPVAASAFFTFLYNIFSSVSFYYEKTNQIMIASVSGALANIILNFIFIRMYGYVAAGYTTLFCYMFFAVAHYIIMKKICKKENIKEKIFDTKFITFLSIVILIITVLFSILCKYYILRYIIILVILTIIIIKRKYFITTLKDLMKEKKIKKNIN